MTEVWDEARVQQYINDGTEESLNLDYKAAGALVEGQTAKKKVEITKDVSAMANSDGGKIIYGIAEDAENRHLPGALDPIHRQDFSKDWLDNVVSSIRPNIEGLIIHPVSISGADNGVAYVVEIPQSHTAHQALDKRYYKRVGFKSRPMEDYEVRDVMNRRQHPRIELKFRILRRIISEEFAIVTHDLEVEFNNVGKVYAQYIVALMVVPCGFFVQTSLKPIIPIKLEEENYDYCQYSCENTIEEGSGSIMYKPILPGIGIGFSKFSLAENCDPKQWTSHSIVWWTIADNAPKIQGTKQISEIEIVDYK